MSAPSATASSSKSDAATSCKAALDRYLEKVGESVSTVKVVKLLAQIPSIRKMDNALHHLTHCEHLSLSTNQIDRIGSLAPLRHLKILSLGRNNIKKIEKVEEVSSTLEQLWLSYNQIDKLDGLSSLKKLKVLYLSNNSVKTFDELLKLKDLPLLEEILLIGNPLYEGYSTEKRRIEVIKRLPKLKKLDALPVGEQEREMAIYGHVETYHSSEREKDKGVDGADENEGKGDIDANSSSITVGAE